MNAALESLMMQSVTPHRTEDNGGDILAFLLVGGGGALGFIVVSSLAVALLPMAPAWLVSSVCYAGFILPVYLLHRRYSFRSDAAHRQALPRYIVVQVMALALATLFGFVAYNALSMPSLPAAILVAGLTAGVNYMVLKSWAFAVHRPALAVVA